MLTAAVIVGGSPLPGRTQENKTASPAAQPPHQSITVGSALPAERTTPWREMDGTHIPIPPEPMRIPETAAANLSFQG